VQLKARTTTRQRPTMQRRQFITTLAAACGAAAVGAQPAWPSQGIRWVVPYPAGGGTDAIARTLAEAMRPALGQSIVVDNRPGAATNIGADLVAKAAPDGYTLMSADNAMMAFNEHLFRKLPYNPEKDFSYIGAIGRFPLVLVVHPSFPAKNFKEFLAYVRANPGKVNYASPGNGSPHHLAMEMFKSRTRTFIVHVPYRGAAPAMQDLMGGQVPAMFLDLAAGLPILQSGKVRPLAIGSARRAPSLPDVPTLAEVGVPDTEVFAFQGLVAPAGLPAPVTLRLNQELNKALASPAVAKRFADFGMEITPTSPEQFLAMARAESRRWGPLIKANGITLD
jgi:tripartite-type tricarboxylate transporter receptor subunit TctC